MKDKREKLEEDIKSALCLGLDHFRPHVVKFITEACYEKLNNEETYNGWDWNKLNGTKNVPDFDKVVLLIEKDGEVEGVKATTGSLESIDSNGCHWNFGGLPNPFDMFGIFGGATSSGLGGDKEKFTPTHWIEVQLPKE